MQGLEVIVGASLLWGRPAIFDPVLDGSIAGMQHLAHSAHIFSTLQF